MMLPLSRLLSTMSGTWKVVQNDGDQEALLQTVANSVWASVAAVGFGNYGKPTAVGIPFSMPKSAGSEAKNLVPRIVTLCQTPAP